MNLSISGLGPSVPDPLGRPASERPTPSADDPTPSIGLGSTREAVGEGSAEGVDPALWGLLSPEERTFYLRSQLGGPATYTSATGRGAVARLGVRLDVRV